MKPGPIPESPKAPPFHGQPWDYSAAPEKD